MPHLILQLALLIAAVFVIGSLIGSFARKRKTKTEPVPADHEQQVEVAASAPLKSDHRVTVPAPAIPEAQTASEEVPDENVVAEPDNVVAEAVADTPAATDEAEQAIIADPVVTEQAPEPEPVIVQEPEPVIEHGLPKLLDAARDGKPDDLVKIKGIGPTLQRKLYGLGIYHYDQLADWNADNALWIGKKLNFRGRVEREEWIAQAAALVKVAAKDLVEKGSKKASTKASTRKTPTSKTVAKAASAKASVKRTPVKKAQVKTAKSKATALAKKTDD